METTKQPNNYSKSFFLTPSNNHGVPGCDLRLEEAKQCSRGFVLVISNGHRCACLEMSTAELEVQQLRAKEELALLRDRVRKSLSKWLSESAYHRDNDKSASIQIDWQVEASQLVQHLCYWEHTSALNKVSMTGCLAEVSRQHRRLEANFGATGLEEPAHAGGVGPRCHRASQAPAATRIRPGRGGG